MSEYTKKPLHIEQVSSKATKPDESRKKSLYFLLLAIGRQRVVENPTFRSEYRSAFNSLKIEKVDDFWEISVSVNGSLVTQLVPRNAFKFYTTGFSEIEDSTVDANKNRANNFWEKIEAEFGPEIKVRNEKKTTSKSIASFRGLLGVTGSTLVVVPLFYSLEVPGRLIAGILIALFPLIRLFWNGSKRIPAILFYSFAAISFALGLDFSLLESNQSSVLAEAAILLFLWVQFYQSRYQRNNHGAAFLVQVLIIVCYASYAFFSGPDPIPSTLTILIIIHSELMQYLRRHWIHSTTVVILTIFFEGTISIAFIAFLSEIATQDSDLSLVAMLFFGSAYLIWFIYLNIYDRFPVTFRLTFPILVSFAILNHNLSLNFSVIALITIAISMLASGRNKKRGTYAR
jgi:hypothetical protein